jgi:hypothetical protein
MWKKTIGPGNVFFGLTLGVCDTRKARAEPSMHSVLLLGSCTTSRPERVAFFEYGICMPSNA